MSLTYKRALAVGTTVALAFLSLFVLPAHSAPSSTPTTCAGVWVVVQSDQAQPSSATIGCATSYATGAQALESAGFTAVLNGSFVSTIDGLPTNTDWSTNGHLSWAYFHGTVNADGTVSGWNVYGVGAVDSAPATGTVEGWILTSVFPYPNPAVDRVFTPTASTTPSASTSTSAPSAAAQKAVPASVMSAGAFINGHLPTADDGVDAVINASFGLISASSCTYAPTVRSLIASIKTQAADYVGTNPGRAAKLAILVGSIGEDPTSFAGLDLMAILAAGTQPGGQVGAYASSFVQSYAVIAYVRSGTPVPALVLSNLVGSQDASGAFGYDFGGFNADYDTTGLAIQALHAAGGHDAAIAKAVTWALSQQNAAQGYWPNLYSPVDSTGLLGSGLELVGTSSGKAKAWLEGQQLPDGGFPAALGSTTSDLMATSDALWLLAGTSLVTVTFSTSGCPATVVPSPGATATTLSSLADTGATEGALGVGLVGTLVLGAGLVLVAMRRRVSVR